MGQCILSEEPRFVRHFPHPTRDLLHSRHTVLPAPAIRKENNPMRFPHSAPWAFFPFAFLRWSAKLAVPLLAFPLAFSAAPVRAEVFTAEQRAEKKGEKAFRPSAERLPNSNFKIEVNTAGKVQKNAAQESVA